MRASLFVEYMWEVFVFSRKVIRGGGGGEGEGGGRRRWRRQRQQCDEKHRDMYY